MSIRPIIATFTHKEDSDWLKRQQNSKLNTFTTSANNTVSNNNFNSTLEVSEEYIFTAFPK